MTSGIGGRDGQRHGGAGQPPRGHLTWGSIRTSPWAIAPLVIAVIAALGLAGADAGAASAHRGTHLHRRTAGALGTLRPGSTAAGANAVPEDGGGPDLFVTPATNLPTTGDPEVAVSGTGFTPRALVYVDECYVQPGSGLCE
jgi:hypothetical protein